MFRTFFSRGCAVLTVTLLLLAPVYVYAEETVKEAGKELKEAGVESGKTFAKEGKKIGNFFKETGKEIGKDMKELGKDVKKELGKEK